MKTDQPLPRRLRTTKFKARRNSSCGELRQGKTKTRQRLCATGHRAAEIFVKPIAEPAERTLPALRAMQADCKHKVSRNIGKFTDARHVNLCTRCGKVLIQSQMP